MSTPGCPRRSATVAWVEVEGEAVLVDEATGEIHRLDRWGTAVWLALDGTTANERVADRLAAVTGADVTVVTADVAEFLDRLGRVQLVEWND